MNRVKRSRFQGVTGCSSLCPEGKLCNCEDPVYSSHELHICSDPECRCHSRERYEGPKKLPSDDWIEVAQIGHLRLVQYTGKVGFIPLKPKDLSYEEYHDMLRAKGLEKVPDEVVPEIYDQLDLESIDILTELMETE